MYTGEAEMYDNNDFYRVARFIFRLSVLVLGLLSTHDKQLRPGGEDAWLYCGSSLYYIIIYDCYRNFNLNNQREIGVGWECKD